MNNTHINQVNHKLFNPGTKPPTGRYNVVDNEGAIVMHKDHPIVVKVVNRRSSKLPAVPRIGMKFKRIMSH